MSDHHVRWSSFIGEHHYVDHIYDMIHARPFGLSVPRPYLHPVAVFWMAGVRIWWLGADPGETPGRRGGHTEDVAFGRRSPC